MRAPEPRQKCKKKVSFIFPSSSMVLHVGYATGHIPQGTGECSRASFSALLLAGFPLSYPESCDQQGRQHTCVTLTGAG